MKNHSCIGQTIRLKLIRVLSEAQNAPCNAGLPIRIHEKTDLKCPSNFLLSDVPLIISDTLKKKNQKNRSGSSKVYRGVIFWGNLDRESFDVAVNGLRMNSELFKDMWTKYNEFCRSQNAFLHEKFLKRNIKLFDGIITSTFIIADGIKGSNLNTFMNDFAAWDQSLEGFEHLGMNVGFIRTKLLVQRLMNLLSKSEYERYSKKRKEALEHLQQKSMLLRFSHTFAKTHPTGALKQAQHNPQKKLKAKHLGEGSSNIVNLLNKKTVDIDWKVADILAEVLHWLIFFGSSSFAHVPR
ncbi:hypothetical protein GIB67_008860, partial [Kingdonia uniflora]